jgi:TolB-like protein/class 3 adenylate cyclase
MISRSSLERERVASGRVERKLAAILAADVAGYSRMAGADEERTLARLRALRGDLIDPAIAAHHGGVVKRTGDGILIEFRSVVDAVRCAIEVQNGMAERNAGLPPERRIEFRVGIHLGDVIKEVDGDLMGDGVNIAARLEGIAEPGSICLSEDAYRQVRDRLSEAFLDLGDRSLKNIARPVRVYAIKTGGSATASRAAPAARAPTTGPPPLSILVLPFANIGGDPEQEYFADGVTESLTTDLSRIAGAFVIARNTAFTYKGKPFDVKKLGRELGVRYVLEGSVQRGGNRMRVNVQLIDAESGAHLWAERFDKPVADLFDMQDEIVARLAGTLSAQLVAAEARRAEQAPDPDSMDLYFQGMACINRGETPEYAAQAKEFFARALALDPGNVEALVGGAFVDSVVGAHMFSNDRAERLAAAEAAATRALSLAPNHAWAHMVLGNVQIFTNRPLQGIAQCERALALDRNLAMAHSYIGHAKIGIGRSEETEAHVAEALRLSPRDTTAYVWMAGAGAAKLYLGADEAAVAWLRRAIENNRNQAIAHFWLAAALAFLGRVDEARAAAQAGLALDPAFTVARFRNAAASDNPVYLRQRERVCDGMREAGVPEG